MAGAGKESCASWKLALHSLQGVGAHLLVQHFPLSVGARLLDAGCLQLLFAAAAFDELRISAFPLSLPIPCGGGRRCIACGSVDYGLAHLLAVCSAGHAARGAMLRALHREVADSLRIAPAGDWPPSLLTPHLPSEQLPIVVVFAQALVEIIRPMANA